MERSVAHSIGLCVEQALTSVLHFLERVPGSRLVINYVRASHQNDPYRTLFEFLLFIFALRYFFAAKRPYDKDKVLNLDENEVDELVREWAPEPLCADLTASEEIMLKEIPVLEGPNGPKVRLVGNPETFLNFTCTDIYGLSQEAKYKKVAIEAIRFSGVGSCGPAGFYGNQVAHISAEKQIAKFLGRQKCIIYAQNFSTATSVIPCFAKRGDILVVDSLVNMSIQRGVQLSRAKILWFKHNDMCDLERQLQAALAYSKGKKLSRRFIITEGLFEYSGKSPDLRALVALKEKYRFRLLLDESWSLGVLGKTGRGLCEEYEVDPLSVDISIGGLSNAVGSSTGFCAADSAVVEHQRIVSLAYTFSATCPGFLAEQTRATLEYMATDEFPKRHLAKVRTNAGLLYERLARCKAIKIISRKDSPLMVFRLVTGDDDHVQKLHSVVMGCREKGILISRLRRVEEFEMYPYVHAIRLHVPFGLSEQEIQRAGDVIGEVCDSLS